jgi:2-phosphosulfolactate phosphatase
LSLPAGVWRRRRLRASSSITPSAARLRGDVAAANIEEARRLHQLPGHLLCGRRTVCRPGLDCGNSPVELSRADLAGKSAILATSNGTRILTALAAESPAVLVGCLLNRTAVARAALDIAGERGLDIAVVCSAAHGGSVFVLEDAGGSHHVRR